MKVFIDSLAEDFSFLCEKSSYWSNFIVNFREIDEATCSVSSLCSRFLSYFVAQVHYHLIATSDC